MKQFDAIDKNVLFIYLSLCSRIEIQYNFVTLTSLGYDVNLPVFKVLELAKVKVIKVNVC